jgi:hypothetical protein
VSVEMANMSWGQVRGVIANRNRWFGMNDLSDIASAEYALKLYASLTAAQMRVMSDGKPVVVAGMKPQQQQTFMQAFEMKARPSYVKAKDQSWPQVSSMMLRPPACASSSVYALSNMRLLDSENIWQHLDPDLIKPRSTQEDPSGSGEQTSRMIAEQEIQTALPLAVNALIQRTATAHPEIPKKDIRTYSMFNTVFEFQIGEARQTTVLRCCMPVQ